jgi:hypothetical protein
MSESMTKAERLAALLDGKLDDRRASEARAELAASDDDLEAYADAVAIIAELEGSAESENSTEEAIRVHPIAPRRRGVGRRWLALAAVLAGVALTPWLWSRFADGGSDAARLAGGLPAGWDASPWGATRGAGDGLAPEARAVRLGARLVDVELAVRGRHPATATLAGETAALLEGIPAASPAAAIYHEVARRAGEPPEQLEPLLEQGREMVPQLAGEEGVKLGSWTEAARIAAGNRDQRFFASRATRSRLEQIVGEPTLPPSARSALLRIRTQVESPGEPDYAALERELAGVLRMLGR